MRCRKLQRPPLKKVPIKIRNPDFGHGSKTSRNEHDELCDTEKMLQKKDHDSTQMLGNHRPRRVIVSSLRGVRATTVQDARAAVK